MGTKTRQRAAMVSKDFIVTLLGRIRFNGVGTPTLEAASEAVESVSRSGVGGYRIRFKENWPTDFVRLDGNVYSDTGTVVPSVVLLSEYGSLSDVDLRRVEFVVVDMAGAPFDPTADETLSFALTVRNSTVRT